MKKLKVGLIGCGTIGSVLGKKIIKEFKRDLVLAYVCDNHPDRVRKQLKELKSSSLRGVTIKKLIKSSDIIIEAASTEVAAEVAKQGLEQNKTVVIMSVGGLLKLKGLRQLVKKSRGQLLVGSGALAGVDAIAAAREAEISSVTLRTRKPPKGLDGAPYFNKRKFPKLKGDEEKCVFRGTADQAVKGFPQNINVAAVLSLAGLGAKKTKVEIWTSRKYKRNQHQVVVKGEFGELEATTTNKPAPDNPKTSYLAALSTVAMLRRLTDSFRVGT